MRWFAKYRDYDERIIKKFLWLPHEIDNESRWLETAYIRQRYFSGTWLFEWWSTEEKYLNQGLQ